MTPELAAGAGDQVDPTFSTHAEVRSVTTTTGIHRLSFVDGLRGFAAVYVVISHCWDTVFTQRPPSVRLLREITASLGFGRYAVTLFIIVSGFSIGLGAWKGGLRWPGGVATYIKRRTMRIWPPYAVAVVISSLIAATALSSKDGTLFDQANNIRWSGVFTHLAMVQDIHWAGPAGSTAFWSVPVEFHIYIVFLAILVAIRRWRPSWLVVVAMFYALTLASTLVPSNGLLAFLGGLKPSLYALFVIGFMAAGSAVVGTGFDSVRWRKQLLGLFVAGIAIVGVCHASWIPLSYLNDLWLGPVFAFVVTSLVGGRLVGLGRVLASRIGVWLGDCSYRLYLIHAVVIEIVWRVAVVPVTGVPVLRLLLELVLGVAASLAVARVFYAGIERPFLRRRARTQQREPPLQLEPAVV